MKTNRLFWIDAVRAISIFLVVVIHVSAFVVIEWSSIPNTQWLIANIYNSCSRISVPLFVIISGLLLLNKHDSLHTFLHKRFKRILLPWFFWGLILILVNNSFSITQILTGDTKSLILENYFGGFWFMPMLAGIYLVTPIIRPFVQKAKKLEFVYFFSLWFLVASLLPTLNKVFDLSISISIPLWLSYLGYFVGGYYINEKVKINKKLVSQSKLLFIFNLFIVIIGTYYLTTSNQRFTNYFYSYLSVPVVLMSFSALIILKDFFTSTKLNQQKTKIINFFSQQSFGIFLSHVLIIRLLKSGLLGFELSSLNFHPFVSIPVISILVFIVSGLLVAQLKKIPLLKPFAG